MFANRFLFKVALAWSAFIGCSGWAQGSNAQSPMQLPRFCMNLPKDMALCREAGVELVKKFPVDWTRIEPFQPQSTRKPLSQYGVADLGLERLPPEVAKQIQTRFGALLGQELRSGTIEFQQDERGRWHLFNWTFVDEYVRSVQAEQMDVMFGLTFNSLWASDPEAFAYRAKKNAGGYNAPLRDASFAQDLQFYTRAIVERFDLDGQADMPGLQSPLIFWEDGNEFNAERFWTGNNEEYFVMWNAFSRGVREASDRCWVVCNGISNVEKIRASATPEGMFSAVNALAKTIQDRSQGKQADASRLSQVEAQLARMKRHHGKSVGVDQLVAALRKRGADSQKISVVERALQNAERSFEFMKMQLDHPELYDAFVPHFYNFYKYDPLRIQNDMEYVFDNMSRRGYRKPIMVMEASGAHLGPSGGLANGSDILAVLKDPRHREHAKVRQWYYMQQASELVKVHATLFANGVDSVVWYMMKDIEGGAWSDSAYSVEGLVTTNGVRKPAYFAYRQLTTMLKGFVDVAAIAPQQVKFTLPDRSSVLVLWSEQDTGVADVAAHFGTATVKVTPVVTRVDRRGRARPEPATEVSAKAVPLAETPVFVTAP